MYSEDKYLTLSNKIYECVYSVFNSVKQEDLYNASYEPFPNGEGISCNIHNILVGDVKMDGFFNISKNDVFVSLFVDNESSPQNKKICIDTYKKLPINTIWEINDDYNDDRFMMITFQYNYKDIDEAFIELKKALISLKENKDSIKILKKQRITGNINFDDLKYTWNDPRNKILIGDDEISLEVSKDGTLSIFMNDNKVNIDVRKLNMIIGESPSLFKDGYVMFYDINDEILTCKINDEEKELNLVIDKKQKKDYQKIRGLLLESLANYDILINI